MSMAKFVLVVYGILLLSGAYFGFKAGSKISLIMGIVSGALVLLGIYLTGNHSLLGFKVIAGVSSVLVVTFAIRLIKTGSFMPSGMLLAASIIALVLCILKLRG